MSPSPEGFDWNDLIMVGSDGVLGMDKLQYAAWMFDYRRKKAAFWFGKPRLGRSVAPEFLRSMGRAPSPVLTLPLTRDAKGWRRTTLRLGERARLDCVFDTGANSLFIGDEVAGLGAALNRNNVHGSSSVTSRAFHLVDLHLPGVTRALPVLTHVQSGRKTPPVLGPDVLTDDWLLFDPIDDLVSFPRPTPNAFAARAADELAGGIRRANRAQLATFADVGTAKGLARARSLGRTFVVQERRRAETRVKKD